MQEFIWGLVQGDIGLRQHTHAIALWIHNGKAPDLPLTHQLFATLQRIISITRDRIRRHHRSDKRGFGVATCGDRPHAKITIGDNAFKPFGFQMEELARLAGTEAAPGRVILGHLGHGASLAAVRDGKPVETSMSFTPTAGVPMSARSGDLDPGLVWYLARTEKMSAKQFNEMVNLQSGLLGISETSSDMRDLLDRETQDVRAAEAVALFCYQVKKCIGAFAAALGGLDTLVFAGGIGENAPTVRARICDGLGFLGIELEEKRNAANEGVISVAASRVAVRVIRTDEERMIAKTVCRVLGLG